MPPSRVSRYCGITYVSLLMVDFGVAPVEHWLVICDETIHNPNHTLHHTLADSNSAVISPKVHPMKPEDQVFPTIDLRTLAITHTTNIAFIITDQTHCEPCVLL